jgi:hypothetical protein
MSELPIACTLGAAALKARREGVLLDLVRRAAHHESRPDGHRLLFRGSDDVLGAITRLIELERQCCRFLRFAVAVEPDGGPISLELTGPPGTGEFLTALLEE